MRTHTEDPKPRDLGTALAAFDALNKGLARALGESLQREWRPGEAF